ncbi:MAG: SWIM zinc finger domain-containing protein [Pseudanabaena sp. SU_2_4]|nr:SWIM zinc finger domain-containing protein [Pseudanabaena sp. SU_2_4]
MLYYKKCAIITHNHPLICCYDYSITQRINHPSSHYFPVIRSRRRLLSRSSYNGDRQRGKTIQADVEGNEASNYRVTIGFDTAGITSAICTCPYNYEGWCKHIAATLLTCVRQPNSIEERPTLVQLLDRLDHQKTQHLIQALVAEQPDLIDAIDRHVSLILLPTPQKQATKAAKAAKTPRRTTIDAAPFRRQVKQILRDGLRYLEEGYEEEDPIADDLREVIGKAEAFTEQGDGNNAIAILEVITATCAEKWDDLSDYVADSEAVCESLNEAWTEAILSAELTDEQKAELQMRLEEWQDQLGSSFEMSLAALEQGWDYPALQRVFEGSITEQGAWDGERPHFVEDLAVIRLRILDRQNRDEEFLYLAEAESQSLL